MSGTRADSRKAREEGDKRHRARVRATELRREVLRDALAEVWSGADFTDADAVLDHLTDRGARIEVQP
jgi:hypothetical protein